MPFDVSLLFEGIWTLAKTSKKAGAAGALTLLNTACILGEECHLEWELGIEPSPATISVGQIFVPVRVLLGRDCDSQTIDPAPMRWFMLTSAPLDTLIIGLAPDSTYIFGKRPGEAAAGARYHHEQLGYFGTSIGVTVRD